MKTTGCTYIRTYEETSMHVQYMIYGHVYGTYVCVHRIYFVYSCMDLSEQVIHAISTSKQLMYCMLPPLCYNIMSNHLCMCTCTNPLAHLPIYVCILYVRKHMGILPLPMICLQEKKQKAVDTLDYMCVIEELYVAVIVTQFCRSPMEGTHICTYVHSHVSVVCNCALECTVLSMCTNECEAQRFKGNLSLNMYFLLVSPTAWCNDQLQKTG